MKTVVDYTTPAAALEQLAGGGDVCDIVAGPPESVRYASGPVAGRPPTRRRRWFGGSYLVPRCLHCGCDMRKGKQTGGNCLGIAVAFFLFGIGALLCFIGLVWFGAPLAVMSLFVGGWTKKVWRCTGCGTIVERM